VPSYWLNAVRPTRALPDWLALDGDAQHRALRQGIHGREAGTAKRVVDDAGGRERRRRRGRPGVPSFTAIKGMTIAGYYSTKTGLEQELGDNGQLFSPVFVGCTHPEHQI
jgi:hypothetical protein